MYSATRVTIDDLEYQKIKTDIHFIVFELTNITRIITTGVIIYLIYITWNIFYQ